MEPPLLVTRDSGIVTIQLDRPEKKNALSVAMFEGLRTYFEEIRANPDDRCVVLCGVEGAFSTGADLSDPAASLREPLEHMRWLNHTALALHELNKPTIAKIDGLAVGAGLGLALLCDLVFASNRSRLSMIFTKRGLAPDFATSWLLPRLVGLHKAKELTFLAEMLDAEQASALGLITRAVPDESLDAVVDELAHRLASGPTVAFGLAKHLLDNASTKTLAEALEAEAKAQASAFGSADTIEAVTAFLERRPPHFTGR